MCGVDTSSAGGDIYFMSCDPTSGLVGSHDK